MKLLIAHSDEKPSIKVTRVQHHDSNEVPECGDHTGRKELYYLPSKIHHRIFSHLSESQDVLRLSLTNHYFWAVGLRHLEDFIMRSMAPWAGERIICVSDQSSAHDFPDTLLSPDEKSDVQELGRIYDLKNFSLNNTWKTVGGPLLSEELQKWFEEYEDTHPMSEADRAEIIMGLKPEILEFFPRDQSWILRNLTTKEYVRGEVIALKQEFVHGPNIEVLGFAEILISRISWSSGEIQFGKDKNLARGKWAGHRFDITTLSVHEETTGRDEWKDISDEILREIDVIIGSQKGDDWRELLSRRHQKIIPTVGLGYT